MRFFIGSMFLVCISFSTVKAQSFSQPDSEKTSLRIVDYNNKCEYLIDAEKHEFKDDLDGEDGEAEENLSSTDEDPFVMKEISEIYSDSRSRIEFVIKTDLSTGKKNGWLYFTIFFETGITKSAASYKISDEYIDQIIQKISLFTSQCKYGYNFDKADEEIKTYAVTNFFDNLFIRAKYTPRAYSENGGTWSFLITDGINTSRKIYISDMEKIVSKLKQATEQFHQTLNRNIFK